MELERTSSSWDPSSPAQDPGKKRVREILARYGLSYSQGGVILGGGSSPASKSLQEMLRAKDLPGVEKGFSVRSPRWSRIRLLVLRRSVPAGGGLQGVRRGCRPDTAGQTDHW
jgi:hypothetical protein